MHPEHKLRDDLHFAHDFLAVEFVEEQTEASVRRTAERWASRLNVQDLEVFGRAGSWNVRIPSGMHPVEVADVIAETPEVFHITRTSKMEAHTFHASRLVQTGDDTKPAVFTETVGLTGEGEVVGVADHCFFVDDDKQITAPVNYLRGDTVTPNMNKRKLIANINIGGSFAVTNKNYRNNTFHGTHVAGIIVGSVSDGFPDVATDVKTQMNKHRGIAPGAKLFFQNIQAFDTKQSTADDPLQTSSDVLITASYGAGVRWGCSPSAAIPNCNYYDKWAVGFDKEMFEKKDLLVVVSVGNSDDGPTAGMEKTLLTPSVAKNVLAVGASQNTQRSFWKSTFFGLDNEAKGQKPYWATCRNSTGEYPNTFTDPCTCTWFDETTQRFKPVTELNGVNLLDESIDPSIRTALSWAADPVHDQSSTYNGYPVAMCTVAKDRFNAGLSSMPDTLCCPNFYNTGGAANEQLNRPKIEEEVASFTSIGPAFDNRIKPDILTPGAWIVSAGADDGADTFQCSPVSRYGPGKPALKVEQGSSMATPVAAGMATLIRQYYREGRHVDGTKQTASGFNPSGSLVKATLINSARGLTGSAAKTAKTTSALASAAPLPNKWQGYGRPQLDRVLKQPSVAFSRGSFHHFEKNVTLADVGTTTSTYVMTVTDATKPILVTMAYSDYPATVNAATAPVINVDMWVEDATGKKTYPNSKTEPDALNNVEHVEIATPTANAKYTVYVKLTSWNAPSGNTIPLLYSVVVTGGFNGETAAPTPAPTPPSSNTGAGTPGTTTPGTGGTTNNTGTTTPGTSTGPTPTPASSGSATGSNANVSSATVDVKFGGASATKRSDGKYALPAGVNPLAAGQSGGNVVSLVGSNFDKLGEIGKAGVIDITITDGKCTAKGTDAKIVSATLITFVAPAPASATCAARKLLQLTAGKNYDLTISSPTNAFTPVTIAEAFQWQTTSASTGAGSSSSGASTGASSTSSSSNSGEGNLGAILGVSLGLAAGFGTALAIGLCLYCKYGRRTVNAAPNPNRVGFVDL
eukprot:tig00020616_g12272.t1